MEIWKDIEGYEGLYKISSLGNIYSIRYKRQLKAYKMPNGYLKVNLAKNAKATQCFVHRLVAQAFLENTNNMRIVIHKDGDNTNNNVDNLEWTCPVYKKEN